MGLLPPSFLVPFTNSNFFNFNFLEVGATIIGSVYRTSCCRIRTLYKRLNVHDDAFRKTTREFVGDWHISIGIYWYKFCLFVRNEAFERNETTDHLHSTGFVSKRLWSLGVARTGQSLLCNVFEMPAKNQKKTKARNVSAPTGRSLVLWDQRCILGSFWVQFWSLFCSWGDQTPSPFDDRTSNEDFVYRTLLHLGCSLKRYGQATFVVFFPSNGANKSSFCGVRLLQQKRCQSYLDSDVGEQIGMFTSQQHSFPAMAQQNEMVWSKWFEAPSAEINWFSVAAASFPTIG